MDMLNSSRSTDVHNQAQHCLCFVGVGSMRTLLELCAYSVVWFHQTYDAKDIKMRQDANH